MTEPATGSETVDPIGRTEVRHRRWAPFWQVAYATLTGLAFLALLGADVVVARVLLAGPGTTSAGLGATLAVAVVLSVMTFVAAWLFWAFGIKAIADLRTGGEFSRTRSDAFKKVDHRFGVIALLSLIVIPFVPILAVLD